MDRPQRPARSNRGWEPRAAVAISLAALGVSFYGIVVAHRDRARDTSYSIRAQVRNASTREQAFGLSSVAEPNQVLEFRARVFNAGNFDARDVTISVNGPSYDGGQLIKGSCQVTKPGKSPARCDDRMDERHLALPTLGPDQVMEVRFKVRTGAAPCDGYRAAATFTARSSNRIELSDTAAGYVARHKDGLECGTDDATLMGLIPADYRESCELGEFNQIIGDAQAHIDCSNPGGGVGEVDYYQYATEDEAEAVFQKRLDGTPESERKACSIDPDGEGSIKYHGRSRAELRYFCWFHQKDGTSWIEIFNRRYKLYFYAERSDDDWTELFDWTYSNTP
jgi:hypothetical protein